jgi:hypothetical protein
MEFKKIVICGTKESIKRIDYDEQGNTISTQNYSNIVTDDVLGCHRINNLNVLVSVMEELPELPTMILIPGLLIMPINDGTFKTWILNGGKRSSGESVNDIELKLWVRFVELYKKLFMSITFKNIYEDPLFYTVYKEEN